VAASIGAGSDGAAGEPLLAHRSAGACVATRAGRPISAGQFVADVQRLARRLPRAAHVVNLCDDRYLFAVSFGASLLADSICLLPPARTVSAVAALRALYPGAVLVADHPLAGLDLAVIDPGPAGKAAPGDPASANAWPPPVVARDRLAAIVFTSGTTGAPQPQPKSWGGLVDGARAECASLQLGRADRGEVAPAVLLGTVVGQHMYGLESTVMLALQTGHALVAERPLHPDEVAALAAAQMSAAAAGVVLVTTPVHLRALAAAAPRLPGLQRVVSATAPLAPELAERCERTWSVPLFEVYGCSETGMIATRRTLDGPRWHTLAGVRVEARGAACWAGGGHVAHWMPLTDMLTLIDPQSFVLEGRLADVVNIAGRRTSLAALERALLAIDGVVDAAYFEPQVLEQHPGREPRLAAFVVAPGRDARAIVAALRAVVEPVFLPRPLILVERLPRNDNGKLPRDALLALWSATGRAAG
jgi:acyl-coenzyme A synthetase/AMP-(fatty) acid ligase